MTTPGILLFILLLLIPLWHLLSRDFAKGLALAIFYWVSMTTMVRIELPGSLPELTIHRLIFISVFIFWLRNRTRDEEPAPLNRYFIVWALANGVSLLGTEIDFITSLKRTLDFVLETFLFYIIITSALKNETQALRVVRATAIGLGIVGVLAILEHYTGFNPVDRFVPGYSRGDQGARDVMSTYQHRILMGTAMAMAVPLAFFHLWRPGAVVTARKRLLIYSAVSLFMTACFFSSSRGPWLGLAGGLGILGLGGSRRVRAAMLLGVVVVAVTLILKPGVYGTIVGAYETTVDTDSHKGGTFQYRLELWRIAHAKISESPLRYLFGFGPGAGEGVEIDWELSYREDRHRERKIESWDNHFAYALFQFGMVGFCATCALIGRVLYLLFRVWREAQPEAKDALLCLLASAAVLVFMMTNVLIFAKQLDYLFWSIAAVGPVLGRCYAQVHAQPGDVPNAAFPHMSVSN